MGDPRMPPDAGREEVTLAILDEIASALSRQLDFDSIVELVGERIRRMFGSASSWIAIHDESTGMVRYPYAIEDGVRMVMEPIRLGEGLTSRVLDGRRPIRGGSSTALEALGAIVSGGATESWLGVPILAGDRPIGVIALESFEQDAFTEADERLLSTVASSMGVALENARLFDETKRLLAETEQRNAELAVINEIGGALARQLDFDAVVEVVGERLRRVLGADDLFIALVDPTGRRIRFPYLVQGGERRVTRDLDIGEGLTSRVLAARQPLRFGTLAEQMLHGPAFGPGIDVHESWLGVPILVGDEAIGIVNVSDHRANAYSEGDERLVATIAASMGVALENARLFAETKHLLGETEQRNAELAVITTVQEGLAAELDSHAMYDLVGDQIRAIFASDSVAIGMVDGVRATITYPYSVYLGERQPDRSIPLGRGLSSIVLESRRPLRLGTNAESMRLGGIVGNPALAVSESWLGVPILAADRAVGLIVLEAQPADAFSEADERLLSTLASSLGTALENVRLFDETKRLLDESERRASELAIVNEIGSALSRQLEFDAIIDLVGERLATMLRTQDMYIALYDRGSGLVSFPFYIDGGVRVPAEPFPLGTGLTSKVLEAGRPLRFSTAADQAAGGGILPASDRRRARDRHRELARRADHGRRRRDRRGDDLANLAAGPSTARQTNASWRRSPRAWASRSRTRGSSRRRSASSPRPTSAQPSSRSSTASSRASRPTSTCSRCTTSSATRSRRSSTPRSWTSASSTRPMASSTSPTRSSAGSGSPTSRSSPPGSPPRCSRPGRRSWPTTSRPGSPRTAASRTPSRASPPSRSSSRP